MGHDVGEAVEDLATELSIRARTRTRILLQPHALVLLMLGGCWATDGSVTVPHVSHEEARRMSRMGHGRMLRMLNR